MLEGISMQQFAKIVEFVQEHHHFGHVPLRERILKSDNNLKDCFHIKYIDNIYDTRTAEIWSIGFRGLGIDIRFSTNHFVLHDNKPDDFKYTNLFDWIMAFLKGEWKPSEQILREMKPKK